MTDAVVWCVPSVDRAWCDAMAAGLSPHIVSRTVLVDNRADNAGVAVSWNIGLVAAEQRRAEWLVLASEALRFGPSRGADVEAALDRRPGPWAAFGLGWHLIAFRLPALAAVGRFDETFWPAYFEDADYEHRMALAGLPSPRAEREAAAGRLVSPCAEVALAGVAHSITSGLVTVNMGVAAARYATKWGGPPGAETYATPYGNPSLGLGAVTLGEAKRAAP